MESKSNLNIFFIQTLTKLNSFRSNNRVGIPKRSSLSLSFFFYEFGSLSFYAAAFFKCQKKYITLQQTFIYSQHFWLLRTHGLVIFWTDQRMTLCFKLSIQMPSKREHIQVMIVPKLGLEINRWHSAPRLPTQASSTHHKKGARIRPAIYSVCQE